MSAEPMSVGSLMAEFLLVLEDTAEQSQAPFCGPGDYRKAL